MKLFQFFQEELNDQQKDTMNDLMGIPRGERHVVHPEMQRISGHTFVPGHSHVIIHPESGNYHSIRQHLEGDGHSVDDEGYINGKFRDRHGRQVSIPKFLTAKMKKAGSEEDRNRFKDLLDRFNRSDRVAETQAKNSVVIGTGDAHQVAEMSTDKPWKSCAGLEPDGSPTKHAGGLAAKCFKDELTKGTMAFYTVPREHLDNLIKEHGMTPEEFHAGGHSEEGKQKVKSIVQKAIDKSEGRMLAKPFTNENGHSILDMENGDRYYSAGDKKNYPALDAVKEHLKKHYKLEPGMIYEKARGLYDDSKGINDDTRMDLSKESIEKIVKRGEHGLLYQFHRRELPHDSLHHLIDHHRREADSEDEETSERGIEGLKRLSTNPSLQPTHIDKLIKHGQPDVIPELARSHQLLPRHIDELLDIADKGKGYDPASSMIVRGLADGQSFGGGLSHDQIHRTIDIAKHGSPASAALTAQGLLSHDNIHKDHMERMLKELKDANGIHDRVKNKMEELEHRKINEELNDPNVSPDRLHEIAKGILDDDNFEEDSAKSMRKVEQLYSISHHPKVHPKTLQTLLKHIKTGRVREASLTNPQLLQDKDYVNKLIQSGHADNLPTLVKNKELSGEHLHQIMDRTENFKNVDDMSQYFMADAYRDIMRHPNHDSSHIQRALDHGDRAAKLRAISSNKKSPEQIESIIKNGDSNDVSLLAGLPHTPIPVLKRLANHDDYYVNREARENLEKNHGIVT